MTTFDFDREYLRNESTYQKSEKLLIIYNHSHVRRKKFGVLWSTNEKVIDSNIKKLCTLMDFFRETTFWPLGGAAPSNFTHPKDWQRLTSTHPKGDGVPPPKKKKKSWKLKICLKIQRPRVHNFRNSGSIFTKLFHATCHYCERNFVFLKLISHSDLRRRAASRLALPCTSSIN